MEFEKIEVNSERWLSLNDLLNEEWKDIKGYEGIYQISNYGRIKSFIFWNGKKYKKRKKCKILKLSKQVITNSKKSYSRYKIELTLNKKRKSYKIHRLIAESFISNPQNKPQINHIDGNPLNNIVSNLEWCTCQENIQHSYKYLRVPYIKYNEQKILNMFYNNIKPCEILKENSISRTVYDKILKKYNIKPQGIAYWKNKYHIDLKELIIDFKNGYKNKELAIKYNTNNNLIAKYRQKYKKGEI